MSMLGKAVIKSSGIFVKLTGSDIETPARTTVEVNDGDTVLVNLENRKLVIIGNQTAIAGPATEGVTSGETSGGDFSIDVGVSDNKLAGVDKPNIKGIFTQSAYTIRRENVIAEFTEGAFSVQVPLMVNGGALVNGRVEMFLTDEGLCLSDIETGNAIWFADDGIHINGDVFINGEKLGSTEEGEEQ